MKKVTIQDIADALDISRVSVWKVFTGREGVSDDLRSKIIHKAIEMGYNMPTGFYDNSISSMDRPQATISVAVSRPETSVFWINLIHEIAREASGSNVNVMYTYLPSEVPNDYVLPSAFTDGSIQATVILNVYNETLIKKLNNLSIPKVFMDTVTSLPFEELRGDLVLIEGRSCVTKITEHILSQGKTRIGFIGDINYAQTNFERYYGYKNAMKKAGIPIDESICLTHSIGADTYKEEITEFLHSLKELPEAFICVNDFVADIVCRALTEMGVKIPTDILISGFDDQADLSYPVPLTTVHVSSSDFGIKLARQIVYRLNHPKASREIIYMCPEVIIRDSTKSKNSKKRLK
ncbi:LacI family DNA-binding transcriptional regulator [Butyrivibrio sp. NC2002]|uniref:LacI family DNA-binding transcriptional regulator n=1 Tax=Butyrivibrio sp. NC2002 TaxID=1410610 RepID=UPI00068C81C4|nr:LacI family DNA-binding transcriptional regulator [Butyrivibrio sp. NC2002]